MFPFTAQSKEVQARASFCSVSGKGTAVSMCYRSLYIGTGDLSSCDCRKCIIRQCSVQLSFLVAGADMDVCLTNYGHCNYVSGKHACIFYDEVCYFKQLTSGQRFHLLSD